MEAHKIWEIIQQRWVDAGCIFVGGGSFRGVATPDIDVIAVCHAVPNPSIHYWRESNYLMDVFVHDYETLLFAIASQAKIGRSAALHHLMHSTLYPAHSELGQLVQRQAMRIWNEGPKCQASRQQLSLMISSLCRDLAFDRPPSELIALSIKAYELFCAHFLSFRGVWGGGAQGAEKLFDRILKQTFPEIHDVLNDAIKDAVGHGNVSRLIALLEIWLRELDSGELFPHRIDLPGSWRIKLPS